MVRDYKKKSNRCNWNEGNMQLAIKSVLDGQTLKSTAVKFGVPRSTLAKKCKLLNRDDQQIPQVIKAVGFSRVFNEEQEIALEKYLKSMENKLMGLTSFDVRKLAFEFAEKVNVSHSFNRAEGLAGKDWLQSFLKRHHFALRKAEHTSAARAHGFNKEAVQQFYTLLEQVLDKYKFPPERIYNVDETGISVVPKSSPKVIAQKGRRQVGGLTAAERGETVTAEICMSASGVFMPPMLIFPRVKVNPEFLKDAPPGAWAEFHKSGYMQSEIFVRWFRKFIEFSQAKPENPVLLLLDGHASHVKNLAVIDLACENGVMILCFPPHCTHKMQPLDVGFMGPLSSTFGKKVSTLQRQGVHMSLRNIFSVFGQSFLEAAKMETAVNSFKRCGISPFNRNIFSESDFATGKKNTCPVPEENSLASSTPVSAESTERISSYLNTILDIMNPSQDVSKSSQGSTFTKENEPKQPDHEVRIPLSYILQAKPLFNFLRPYFDKVNVVEMQTDKSPLTVATDALDVPGLASPIELEATSTADNAFIDSEIPCTPVESTSTSTYSSSTPAMLKKGRARGEAAIITDNTYKENLMAEKLKNIKKEKIDKKTSVSKPVITSNVALESPLIVTTRQPTKPVKRKQPASNQPRKKREPLKPMNYQVQEVPILMPMDNQFYQKTDNSVIPVQEGTYILPVDDAIAQSFHLNANSNENMQICYIQEC